MYQHQADALLQRGSFVTHGPDNPDSFAKFSLDTVIAKLQDYAPDLLSLFMQLGVGGTPSETGVHKSFKEIRATSSLCTLLGARSNRAKGLQLLIGLMLIARSTSRQVSVHLHKNTWNTA